MKLVHDRSLYRNHGCRCKICREANTAYTREYRANEKLRYKTEITLQAENHVKSDVVVRDDLRWWHNTSGMFEPMRKRQIPQKPYAAGYRWAEITDAKEITRLERTHNNYVTTLV